MVTFNFQHMVMLLVLVILLALNKVTLANPEPSAGVGECQDYVPIINDEKCQDGELLLKYSPVLSPNSTNNSKPSKRFQICNDDEGIGKNGNAYAFTCTNNGTNREMHFHGNSCGISKEDFNNAMKDGALLADYLGIWMIGIDFELKQNWQSIMQSGSCELKCENNEFFLVMKMMTTTEMPTTMSPEELALYSKCNCSWESLEKAVIKIDQGKGKIPKISYTLRVGYIENSTNQLFEKFVKNFLDAYETKIEPIGGDIQNVREWMDVNNDWIHELPYNEFRYVPLKTYIDDDGALKNATAETPMMFCVFRCPLPFDGAFAIAPTKHDEKLAGKLELSTIQHNWTNDFDFLFDCWRINIETNWQKFKFSEQMAKIKRLFIDMDFGIIYKNQFNGMPLTAAQIEAHKFRFGNTIPLRSPEYNQTTDNYKVVRSYGVFFAPRDDAYKEKRTFSIHVNYNALRYSALISRGIATDDEESRKFWSDQIVTFFILQENIVCPDFNVTFPRINVVARVYVDGAPISWGLLMDWLKVINDRDESLGTMQMNDMSEYELYKKLRTLQG